MDLGSSADNDFGSTQPPRRAYTITIIGGYHSTPAGSGMSEVPLASATSDIRLYEIEIDGT